MKKYYLMYLKNNGVVDTLGTFFPDISFIDNWTTTYTKQDFLELYSFIPESSDLFIGKVTSLNNGKEYDFAYYEVLWHQNENHYKKIQEYFEKIAYNFTKKKEDYRTLELFVNAFCKSLFQNSDQFEKFSKSLKNPFLKEYLWSYYAHQQSFERQKIISVMQNYANLRSCLYLYYKILFGPKKNISHFIRDNYLYSSHIFDFDYHYPIFLFEALNKNEECESMEEKKMRNVLTSPFDSKELEQLFEIGGIEYVLYHMDTNLLYQSTTDDLLRLGIYNKNYYLSLIKKQE